MARRIDVVMINQQVLHYVYAAFEVLMNVRVRTICSIQVRFDLLATMDSIDWSVASV